MNRRIIQYLLTLALPLTGAVPATAQQQPDTATFRPHWYVQPQAGIAWTTGEAALGKLLSPAAQIAVGRQMSPLLGLRLTASGWQGRNWQVAPAEEYKWKHVTAAVDATLSLTDLIAGYCGTRRWNAYAFIGAGIDVAFGNDDANSLAAGHPTEFGKAWDGTCLTPAARGGLGVEYSLSQRVALGLEANTAMLPDKWNSKPGSSTDWQSHLLLGVKIALGKTAEREAQETILQPVVEEQQPVVEEQQPVAEEQQPVVEEQQPVVEEQQPVVEKQQPVVEKQQPVAEEQQPVTEAKDEVKIYFAFNSSRITRPEAAKLRQLARYMRSHRRRTLNVTGYASPEGRRRYNRALSGWRAEAVKNCLVSYGVDASRIKTSAKGEIDLGDPAKSRSAICITIE